MSSKKVSNIVFTRNRPLQLEGYLRSLYRFFPSENRAGMASLRSLVFRSVFAVVGPIVGVAVDTWGMHWVLGIMGVVFAAILSVLLVGLRSYLARTD